MADTTQIGRNTAVSGRVAGSGPLAVEGRLEGSVELSEGLYIGTEGFVKGTVSAREVVIDGSFSGEIVATEKVVLNASARALAKITSPLVQMADGAQLQGEMVVGEGLEPVATRSSTPRQAATVTGRSTYTTSTAPTKSTDSRSSSGGSAGAVGSAVSTPATAPKAMASATQMASAPWPTSTTVTVVEEPDKVAAVLEESAFIEEIDELRDGFTVKELRDELRRRDLPVSGTKDELIERLLLAQADEGTA